MRVKSYKIKPGANLTGADLTGANLTGANLTGANLTRANLTRANLRDAHIHIAGIIPPRAEIAIPKGGSTIREFADRVNLAVAKRNGPNLTGATMPDGTIHE